MFHITGYVVQEAAAKAKRALDEKQEALAQAQKDEQEKKGDKKDDSEDGEDEEDASENEEDASEDDEDDDEPISKAAKRKAEIQARDARKEKIAEEANAKLKKKQAFNGRGSKELGEFVEFAPEVVTPKHYGPSNG